MSTYLVSQLLNDLDVAIPSGFFHARIGEHSGGKVVWIFGDNAWTMFYVQRVECIETVEVTDERGRAKVYLFGDGVTNLQAVLRAVGAVPH